jgi:hypothetical protein
MRLAAWFSGSEEDIRPTLCCDLRFSNKESGTEYLRVEFLRSFTQFAGEFL